MAQETYTRSTPRTYDELLESINPSLDADQVIELIRIYNEQESVRYKEELSARREALLRDNDKNPEDWTFFTNHLKIRGGAEFTEEDLSEMAKPFPSDIEFLVLPGAFKVNRGTTMFSGLADPIGFKPNQWSVFIRDRRRYQLQEPVQKA